MSLKDEMNSFSSTKPNQIYSASCTDVLKGFIRILKLDFEFVSSGYAEKLHNKNLERKKLWFVIF